MKRIFRCAVIGVSATMLAVSGASLAMAAQHHRGQKHVHHLAEAGGAASQGDGVRAATPGSVGSFFGGLGGAYDNSPFGYDGPLGFGLRAKAQIGSALVGGGAAGDAYTDYLQHYYYYKYDACPLGSKYVWYLRRCFSPLDLFR